ncbi:MAG TPA: tyrosine-type recombinase/integrase [Mycobacterium sp.]|nr:tyrosine-type recombinase/integrase [Mycobacterium sp.]
MTPAEFEDVRIAVKAHANREGIGGPKPGRLLPEFIEVLAATGGRPSEVLALRWSDVDLLADPPTVTSRAPSSITNGSRASLCTARRPAKATPQHTVVLPRFGVEAFTALLGETGPDGPVFVSREGSWMSLANLRRALRAALPEDLRWVTPHSFRRTVATVVRDDLGPALA